MCLNVNREETSYGIKCAGNSQFIVAAPHAAGDDWKTSRFAKLLAKEIEAALVVNNKYYKPDNKFAQQRPPEFAADFNKLCWSPTYNKYLWKRKPPAMKEFYMDVVGYCKTVKKSKLNQKAVVVYIHGMSDKKNGIDLGVGLKAKDSGKRFLNKWDKPRSNSGVITIQIKQLKKLKTLLEEKLEKDHRLSVSIGSKHIGWSKQSAIQLHKHNRKNEFALQIEVNRKLRRLQNLRYSVKLLADALIAVFGK